MKIIALTGPKMVGKTSVANEIASRYHNSFRLSFADPIRDMLCAMGISYENLFNQELKEKKLPTLNKSPRELMQTLGTEWGRNMIYKDIWLWAMNVRLLEIEESEADMIVIDDLRFDNEAKWVQENYGTVVRLHRKNFDYGKDSHCSEKPISLKYTDFTQDASDIEKAVDFILSVDS